MSIGFQSRKTSTNTADVELVAAPVTATQICVTSFIISNPSSTDSEVDFKSATTIIATFPAPNKGGCVAINLKDPLLCNVNEALNFASTISVTTMKVTVLGHYVPYLGEPSIQFIVTG